MAAKLPVSDEASLAVNAFVAWQIRGGPQGFHPVRPEGLSDAISDIQIETTISGSSQLVVTLSDHDWSLLTSGWLNTDASGYLLPIAVQYPAGFEWVLAAVDITTDVSQPNLKLTFEDVIVWDMRQKWGPKKATRSASMTRAEFIQSLAREAGVPNFVAPELKKVQPITDANAPQTVNPVVPGSSATSSAKNAPGWATNPKKQQGVVANSAHIKVKGQPISQNQVRNAETLLGVAAKKNAPTLAAQAIICAAIGESTLGDAAGTFQPNGSGYWGVLQGGSGQNGSQKNFPDPHDTAAMALSFLDGGRGFQAGGAIKLSQSVHDPGEIATRVEASGQPGSFYGIYLDEANAIIKAYGWIGAAGGSAADPANGSASTYSFQRGTNDNRDEDSWTCANRLAQEVNWSIFSNGFVLYYMNGLDLIAQKPAFRLDREANADIIASLEGTFDNTAFAYRSTHKPRGGAKVQRQSNLQKLNTPTEIKLDLVCGIDDFRAGDVFEIANSGPLDGRWIIADAIRSVFNTYTEFTLSPPLAPLPEPAGTTSSSSSSGGSGDPSSGGTAKLGSGKYSALVSSGLTFEGPDQGIDFTGKGDIYVLDNCTVTNVEASGSGWPGGALICYQLNAGPNSGRYVYIAEAVKPINGLRKGSTLKKGERIATLDSSYPGTEIGWSQDSHGTAYGTVRDGKPGGPSPTHGIDFGNYVQQVSKG